MQRSATSTSTVDGRRRPSLDADPFANAKRAHEANLILRHGLSPKAASYLSDDRPPSASTSYRPPTPLASPMLGDFVMDTEEEFDYFSAAIASNPSSEGSSSCLPTPDEPQGRNARWSTSSGSKAFSGQARISFDFASLRLSESPAGLDSAIRRPAYRSTTTTPILQSTLERYEGEQSLDGSSPRSPPSRRGTSPQKHRSRKAALLQAAKDEEAFGDFSDMEDYRLR